MQQKYTFLCSQNVEWHLSKCNKTIICRKEDLLFSNKEGPATLDYDVILFRHKSFQKHHFPILDRKRQLHLCFSSSFILLLWQSILAERNIGEERFLFLVLVFLYTPSTVHHFRQIKAAAEAPSHIISTARSRDNKLPMLACLLACFQLASSSFILFRTPCCGDCAAHNSLTLPESIKSKTISHRHDHRLTWSWRFFIIILFPGDFRLYQVGN